MNEVFKITLSLSCSGALLTLVLFLFRPLFQSRLSKQWQYYIWLVVVARLLLPFAPETNVIGTLFQKIDNAVIQPQAVPPLEQNISFEPVRDKVELEKSGAPNEPSKDKSELVLWPYWLVIAFIRFIRKITIYQSFVNYIKAGSVQVEDIALLERFGKQVEQSRIKTAVDLYTNNLISSPLLIGFFRPYIVLPTDALSDVEFQYIIKHELTHFKRRDMFYKWLVQVAICVHWFNPLVYLMGREVERTCELSCDEAVIKNVNAQERRIYGFTLLNAIGNGGSYKNSSASVTLCETKERLKERLDAIVSYHKKSKLVISFTVVLSCAVCFGAAAMGAYAAAPLSALETAPISKPTTIGDLVLIEKIYTMEELAALHISNISINALSDHIAVVRGGDTLKFEYYALNPNEYEFLQTNYEIEERWTLALLRRRSTFGGDGRSITITVPEQFPLEDLAITTTSGNISLTDCVAESVYTTTQNGEIDMRGGIVLKNLHLNTTVGDALVSETSLPQSSKNDSYGSVFNTESGTMIFQPADSKNNYRFYINYGPEAEFFVNGEGFEAGYPDLDSANEPVEDNNSLPFGQEVEGIPGNEQDYLRKSQFIYNEDGATKVYFNSQKGSFMVQEK